MAWSGTGTDAQVGRTVPERSWDGSTPFQFRPESIPAEGRAVPQPFLGLPAQGRERTPVRPRSRSRPRSWTAHLWFPHNHLHIASTHSMQLTS